MKRNPMVFVFKENIGGHYVATQRIFMETNLSMSNTEPIKSRYASLKSERKDASRNQSVFGRLLLDQTKRRVGFEILEKRAVFNAAMVVDVNDYPTGFQPNSFFSAGDHVFFTAIHPYAGNEVWKSDGTADGTSIVKDIYPGVTSGVGSIENFVAEANGTVYFRAIENYAGTGAELWRSDGTDAGTSLVKDIHVGSGNSNPSRGCNVGGTFYFAADDGTNGRELWKSDGTEAGTVLVKNINSAVGSDPFGLVAVGSVLFFIADDGSGRQVWKSDGTDEGTIPVTDATGVGYITVVGGVAYFSSNDGSHGYELWRSDGTADGTMMVKDIHQGVGSSQPAYLTNVSGVLFFRADGGGGVGSELWRSDGTADGTFMVKDINSEFLRSGFPRHLTNVNGKLFFSSNDGSHGYELWRSDGTDQGTEMIQDIHPSGSSNIAYLTNVNGTLFFRADDGATGEEIWSSGGIPGRASRVKDIFEGGSGSNPRDLRNLNGSLIFSATANESIGPQIWISNGSDSTTRQITNVIGSRSSDTTIFGYQKSTVYFTATDASNNRALWTSDGNTKSSQPIKNLTVLGPSPFTALVDQVFFVADDGTHGQELWRSDGTESGTVLVKDIQLPGAFFSQRLCNVNGTLFFIANDGTNGRQLWKSDGTEIGTEMVSEDVRLGAIGSQIRLVNYNGLLLFGAPGDKDLWSSDGTSSGTNPIKSFDNGSLGFGLDFTISNGFAYFAARTNDTGEELWKTDGTPDGTQLVKDIHPGGNWSNPRELTDASGVLYFFADNGTNGMELWKSDGTLDGTQLVRDIRSDGGGFQNRSLTNVNGTVYFSANDGTHGYELWKSNGSVDGTELVQDIAPGNQSSFPRYLREVNGTLYFTSDDGTRGRELWQITNEGAEIVADIAEGAFSSNPSSLINGNGQLYFSAANNFGQELWTIDGPTDIHLTSDTLPENQAVNSIIGQLNSRSISPSDTFVYTLVAGAGDRDNDFFSVEGGNLLANNSFDFESQSNYTVRVRSTDQDGFYLEESFGIWVTDINEAPTSITIYSSDLLENAGVNAVIGALSTVDPDAGNAFTYTLVVGTGDGDNSAFNIDGNNLRANASFDFETKSSYTIRVRSTDQGCLFTEKAFTISVLNVNETPVDIELTVVELEENAGADAVVGALSTVDPDAGNTFTYTLVSGTGDGDNSAFNIDGNNLRANASFDFETKSSYTVRVRSTDQGGLFTEKAFTISVTDVPEGVLVNGTSGADTIMVTYLGDGTTHTWSVKVNAAAATNVSGNLIVEGLAGNDTLQVIGRAANDLYVQEARRLILNGAIVQFPGIETLRVVAGFGDDTIRVLEPVVTGVAAIYDGGGGSDTLETVAGTNTWNVTGAGVGNLNGAFPFLGVESLQGGTGNDQFLFSSLGRLSGGLFGGDGQDSVNLTAKSTSQIINLQSGVTSVSNGFGQIEQVVASNATGDLLIGTNTSNVWSIQGTNSGTLNRSMSFSGFESIAGGSAADQFLFDSSGQITGRISGGDGADVLDLSQGTSPQSYRIGALSSVDSLVGAYTSIEQVTGNNVANTKLIGPSTGAAWSVLPDGQISINGVNYRSIREISGGSGADTILGPAQSNTWSILATNAGRLESATWSIDFQGTENLYGSSGVDSFVFANDGRLSGSIVAGTGSDQLNLSAISSELLFDAASNPKVQLVSSSQTVLGGYFSVETITGNALSGTRVKGANVATSWLVSATGQLFHNSIAYLAIGGILSGTGVDTLTGPSVASQWSILGSNAGQLSFASTSLSFSGVENLTGGTADDSFDIAPAGSLTGNLNGGTGSGLNALSYSQWDAGVSVNLASSSSGNATAIAGRTTKIQMVTGGSGNDTLTGQASKSTILVGLGGSDRLVGGSQRDILLGGLGTDTLLGGNGDDLMISGTTTYDLNREGLFRIYAEWISARTFAQRTANIWGNGTGARVNENYFFNSDPSDGITDTVFADSDVDSLSGGLNQDWFFASLNDTDDFVGTGATPDRRDR